MNWKNRLTNYNFWISIVSAVLLILQAFEFHFDIAYINEIATAVLGLLVVIGIINDPTKTYQKTVSKEEKKVNETPKQEKIETPVEEIVKEEPVVDEKTFPIAEQNEVNDDNIKNDVKDIVEAVNEEKNDADKLLLICKNLLNYLSKDLQAEDLNVKDEDKISPIKKDNKIVEEINQNIHTDENVIEKQDEENFDVNKEEKSSSFNIVN